jgi:nanoRNase/pAp phosphatase (c-di-AMP/oligoRNAs hydrolase)
MRSHGRINVTSIAKSLGGGGHDNGRAAGCRTEVIRDGHLLPVGAPYKAIVDALRVAQMWRNLVPSVK